MKKLIYTSLIATLFIGFNSCKPEELTNEEDGDARDNYVGKWTANSVGTLSGNKTYDVEIKKDASFPNRVNLYNGYNLGAKDSIIGNVSAIEAKSLTIPTQVLKDNQIKGSGNLESSQKLVLSYTVNDGNDIDTVTSTYTR